MVVTAGTAAEVCGGLPNRVRVAVSLFRGCRDLPRVPTAGPRRASSCATRDGLTAPKKGGKPACRDEPLAGAKETVASAPR
jgi:hypothetical protein